MDILNPPITDYLNWLHPERPARLRHMETEAAAMGFPIVGPLVGNFLAQMASVIDARRILELGSGFGYSAGWFASVLPADGAIICTDGNPQNRERAMESFAELGCADKVSFFTGDALEIAAGLLGEFDLIFCDIDKHDYPRAYEEVLPKLRSGGLLLFDNALWSGRMLENDESPATKGVAELNKRAFSDPRVRCSIIPLRDGVLVCLKR